MTSITDVTVTLPHPTFEINVKSLVNVTVVTMGKLSLRVISL